jgi:hypothetical protein
VTEQLWSRAIRRTRFADDPVVIHGETLPLSLSLPNTNAPPEVVHDAAQVLN